MRRMNADNHRGQEDKSFQKQAGYMRAMIFSHISEFCLASRSGSIYAEGRAKQEAKAKDIAVTCQLVPDVPHLRSGSCTSPRDFVLDLTTMDGGNAGFAGAKT